jgi:hypothetical protein
VSHVSRLARVARALRRERSVELDTCDTRKRAHEPREPRVESTLAHEARRAKKARETGETSVESTRETRGKRDKKQESQVSNRHEAKRGNERKHVSPREPSVEALVRTRHLSESQLSMTCYANKCSKLRKIHVRYDRSNTAELQLVPRGGVVVVHNHVPHQS